jgi:DNA repair protein RecN (Recombination protein N)
LAEQVVNAERDYQHLAQQISVRRHAIAQDIGIQVTATMQTLGMVGGCFEVALLPCSPTSTGLETIEFRVAGHAGATPRNLAKVASGGELARISLALAVMTAHAIQVDTLIFDEVDTGIGGATAEIVGQLLRRLAETAEQSSHQRQVLCVTHLAQVAAQGHHHFQISKHTNHQQQTISQIHALHDEARITEIARMLGGVQLTDATRLHAQEMLNHPHQ